MNSMFRERLGDMTATFRNNPGTNVLIVAYGTKPKEIRDAKDLTAVIKTYFIIKEGISKDRLFTKVKPMQKGKERTFDIEPCTPE